MAIALGPRYPTAHQWYGELLYHTGKVDSAIVEIRRAQALDPLAPIIAGALAFALNLAGKYDECIAELKKGLELAPQLGLLHSMVAFCQLHRGNTGEAVRAAETMVRLDRDYSVRKGQLAYIYGLAGQREKAEVLVKELAVNAQTRPLQWFPLAMGELGLADKEASLSALERAVDGHEIGLIEFSLLNDRMWDLLRPDPRFQRILERMNLARYPARRPA
jgi:tetratricopeptide (TPR) repeat protein